MQVTDDRGRVVKLPQPPQRIVSLLPSLARNRLRALGECQRLVGVDRFTNWPASVRQLPQSGRRAGSEHRGHRRPAPGRGADGHRPRARPSACGLGVPVVALETKTHADVQRVLAKVGQLLGVSDAQRVWRHIDAAVSAAAQSLPPARRGFAGVFRGQPGPVFAAGEASFIGETLTRLGARNILPASLGPSPSSTPNTSCAPTRPAIMVGARSSAACWRPGWAPHARLRQHLCVFNADESGHLIRPGPRMAGPPA